MALMEAMASGLPCVVSKIRGNTDLINEHKSGKLVPAKDSEKWFKELKCLITNKDQLRNFAEYNRRKARDWSVKIINKKMQIIYLNV